MAPVTPTQRVWRAVRPWKWEAGACVLSLVALAAIVATVQPHAGKPLPQWPFKITVNGLLSIYSIVLRASLATVLSSCIAQMQWVWFSKTRRLYDLVPYDGAGRGPWGSVGWLWHFNGRERLTALGALLTVACVTIDPIIQQLLNPSDCVTSIPELNATLTRASMFTLYDATSNLKDITDFHNALDETTKVAASTSGPDADTVALICPTGNCTFPVFPTLGICSICSDASSEVIFRWYCCTTMCNCTEVDANTECPDDTAMMSSSQLPSGLQTRWDPLFFDHELGGDNNTFSTFNVSHIPGQDSLLTIEMIFGVESGPMWISPCDSPWNITDNFGYCAGYGAARCKLSFCVRMHDDAVVDGSFVERVVATSQLEISPLIYCPQCDISQELIGLIDVSPQCISTQDLLLLIEDGSVPNGTQQQQQHDGPQWEPYHEPLLSYENSTYGNITANMTSLLRRQCLHLVDVFAASDLVLSLSNVLSGNMTGSPDGPSVLEDQGINGPDLMQYIYNYGNTSFARVESTVTNLSTALTHLIGAWGETNFSEPVQGTVLRPATCLDVRWAWLAGPASLLVLTAIYFAAVVLTTKARHMPIWKSSPLPWIERGPGGDALQHKREDDGSDAEPTIEIMEDRAKKLHVRLDAGANRRIKQVLMSGHNEGSASDVDDEEPGNASHAQSHDLEARAPSNTNGLLDVDIDRSRLSHSLRSVSLLGDEALEEQEQDPGSTVSSQRPGN